VPDVIGRWPMETRKPLGQPPLALLGPLGFLRSSKNEEHQHRHNDDDQNLLRTKQYGQHDELLHALMGFAILSLAIDSSITYNSPKPV
jgi:hypothetical protein